MSDDKDARIAELEAERDARDTPACPSCGKSAKSFATERIITYGGLGEITYATTAWGCESCDEQWLGAENEDAEAEAIRKHLHARIAELEAKLADECNTALKATIHDQKYELARLNNRIAELERERDALLTRLGHTEESRDTIRGRCNRINRLDLDDPATYCLHALNEGEISLAKACEWLRKYLLTGAQDPIKQGIMRSGGADESLREVREQRDALAAAYVRLRDAAVELREVLVLRGEDQYLPPPDDPLLWTARRNDAYGEFDIAIDACEDPQAILAARLAQERKAGAVEALRQAADEHLQAAMEMLRRGQKAIERQEWEKGETAQEWYFAAGQLAHQIQMEMEFSRDNVALKEAE